MYEVEVKVRTDHDRIRSQLNELNEVDGSDELDTLENLDDLDPTRTHIVQQTDTYYDAPHRDFSETDEALRIREETDKETESGEKTTQLTYKGPLVDDTSKTREESETSVDSQETMDAILRNLGFSPAAVVEKEREQYALGEYTVTLDTVSDLGEFVEVERVSDDAEIEAAREGAFSILRALDLDPDDQIRTSYLGLLIDNIQQ